jgi:DNA-binding CsgD family transcriptional regulator/tetratricopeptide (TPR) repeat protein
MPEGTMERTLLWERDHLLVELLDRLAAAGRGTGALVFLAGEAGAGKTSVADVFAAQVRGRATVLSGGCDPLTTPRPLSPLLDIAADPAAGLPDLAGERGGPTVWFGALLDRFKQPGRPTVVVVEDVHWADDATLDFLRYIGRRIGDSHALMLCTYRDDELGRNHPLRVTLGDLAARGSTAQLTVDPLSVAAVRGLADGLPVDPERLHRMTGGNPFYLTEVLATGEDIPPSVQEAVLARVSRLSDGARRVVDAVSIAPRQLAIDHALDLSGTAPADVDEAASSGVLVGAGSALRFRHELARSAVAETLPVARRLFLHRRMLGLLAAERRPDLARLAHHAVMAEAGELVVRYAPAAAREAAGHGADKEAAGFYRMALEHPRHLDAHTTAELRLALADALIAVNQPEPAVQLRLDAVLHGRTAGDPQWLGRCLTRLAEAYWLVNRRADSRDADQEATALLRPLGPSVELGRALTGAAWRAILSRHRQAALSHASEAMRIAGQVGDAGIEARALGHLGLIEITMGGNITRGLDLMAEDNRRLAEIGEPLASYRGLVHLGWAAAEVRRYTDAIPPLERVVAIGGEIDFDYNVDQARTLLAQIAFEQGRWTEATALAEQVIDGPPDRSPLPAIRAYAVRGRIRVRSGERDGRDALSAAVQLADGAGLLDLWSATCGLAELAWLEGQADQIPDLLRSLFDRALAADSPWARGEIGYWMWRAGAIDQPPESAAEPYARQMRGDWAGAAVAWREIGCPYEQALALADGDQTAQLAAMEILDDLGARPAAAWVRAQLRDQGMSVIPRGERAATRAHPAGLTIRQAEVLTLMTDGLSNTDIADRLFITPKTVEHHVSAIFAKLGATNRAQAIVKANELSS